MPDTQPTLNASQQQTVIACTHAKIQHAREIFHRNIDLIPITFDLTGSRAGMFVYQRNVFRQTSAIRFNPAVFALDFTHHCQDTVAHEVAHYITLQLHGSGVRPHGREWKNIAGLLGCIPKARSHYNIEGLAVRRQRRFRYRCQCREFSISCTLHRRIQNGQQRYCRSCRQPLQRESDNH